VLRSVGASSALAVALLGLAAAPASAVLPGFGALTGAANPLDGVSVNGASRPALGDLDGDGDLDLATGRSDGSFAVHDLPEPGRGLVLGAGIALLWGLRRVRRWGRTQRSAR
jgi:hypothetical protein